MRSGARLMASFLQQTTRIAEGDTVIAYQNVDSMSAIRVRSGDTYNNKFGAFRHADLIGKPFGSKARGCATHSSDCLLPCSYLAFIPSLSL
jgi:tRNA A58 N-methylase Trm61